MTLYWAIAVGINQYQQFQPLIYAARDAQALHNCLTNEVGFAAAHTVLLTDDTAPHSLTPDRHTIQSTVAQVCQQVQPGDVLWFFFSGYGVQYQGRDYLMPMDGDPLQVGTTGIAVESLFSILQSARTDNVLVLLDINRSQGIMAGMGVGAETARLAQDYGMATILSCPAEQFSHETLALRLGLFTTAVLEGLRTQRCVTTEHLGQFLRDRLPELTEHHWRPRQDPVVIIPDSKRFQLIVPGKAVPGKAVPGTAIAPSPDSRLGQGIPSDRHSTGWSDSGDSTDSTDSSDSTDFTDFTNFTDSSDFTHWPDANFSTPDPGFEPELPRPVNPSQPTPPAIFPPPFPLNPAPTNPTIDQGFSPAPTPVAPRIQPPTPAADAVEERSWRRLLQRGGMVLSVLLAAVLVRNVGMVTQVPDPSEQVVSPSPVQPDPQVVALAEGGRQGGDGGVSLDTGLNPAVNSLVVPSPPVDNAIPNPAVSPAAPSPTSTSTSTDPLPPAPPPPNPISSFFSDLFKSPEGNQPPGIANSGTDAAILNSARAALSRSRGASASNQVTEIAEAITVARQIRPGQPSYAQAQADIDRWSAMILDMARGRAAQRNGGDSLLATRNYTQAIAAARLVPNDRPDTFAAAQQNMNEWSQSLLALATINAGLGDLNLAIQVAQQIPQNTVAYPQAQEAIAVWQNQLAQTVGLGNEDEPIKLWRC